MHWLFEAKKRFGLCILNFTVTSNHVHLLVYDMENGKETIPKSIQLIAGKTGQEFNTRKRRKGAYWQDRYHLTAVATDDHLIRCVVKHPKDWPFSGYRYILAPPKAVSTHRQQETYRVDEYQEIGRRVIETRDSFVLKEMQHPYESVADKATDLQPEDNTFYWQNRTEANLDSSKSLEGSF